MSCPPTGLPTAVASFASEARQYGYGVIICGGGHGRSSGRGGGGPDHVPVIGVPLSGGAIGGVDALYATVQMPRGVPVATVAIDGAVNAALLAIQILAVTDDGLAERLAEYRDQWQTVSEREKCAMAQAQTIGASGRAATGRPRSGGEQVHR